jgi:GAF domain-containing protein
MNTHVLSRPDEYIRGESETQRHRATFLKHLLLTAVVSGLVALILTYVALPESMATQERLVETAPFIIGWLVVLITWIWRGLGYRTRSSIVIALALVLSVLTFRRGGLPGSGRVWLLALPAIAFLLGGLRSGIAAGAVSLLTYAAFALAFSQKWLVPLVVEDPAALKTWISEGGSFLIITLSLTLTLWSSNRGWTDALAESGRVNEQLQNQTQELEATNEHLRQQSAQLRTTAEIAKAGSSILDLERLQEVVVNRIQDGFGTMGVYYVGLFLLDESQQVATLTAATGEAGHLLLEMGYQLGVNEISSIGWCIAHQLPRIVLDVGENAPQFNALSMPHTRSEVALPLRSRGRVLGALSVQSTQEGAFSEVVVAILQTMADQIAVAIDNAQLFQQNEAALSEVHSIQRRYVTRAWKDFLARRPTARVGYTESEGESVDRESLQEAQRTALTHQRTVAHDSADGRPSGPSASTATLVVPLKLRGQVIGTISLQETRQPRSWTADEITLAETMAEQTALTIETLRLMDETQRHAAHEELISEVTTRMRETLDVEIVLRTAAREMREALGLHDVSIQLEAPSEETRFFMR